MRTLIIILAMFPFIHCIDDNNDCPEVLAAAAEFELIDSLTNHHIIDAIISSYSELNNDSMILNPTKDDELLSDLANDSIYTIYGNPSIYSFKISCNGYRDTLLKDIKIDYSGNPECNIPKLRTFRIILHKVNQ